MHNHVAPEHALSGRHGGSTCHKLHNRLKTSFFFDLSVPWTRSVRRTSYTEQEQAIDARSGGRSGRNHPPQPDSVMREAARTFHATRVRESHERVARHGGSFSAVHTKDGPASGSGRPEHCSTAGRLAAV